MSKLNGNYIEQDSIQQDKIELDNNSYLKGKNAANDGNINLLKINLNDEIEFDAVPIVSGDKLESTANKNQANGYAGLDGDGKLPVEIVPSAGDFANEKITLTAIDISNGYVDLANAPISGSIHLTPKGSILQDEGTDYTVLNNRITFAGDLASLLAENDILIIKYSY